MNTLERLASALAVTFNGGRWDTHYTEGQKALWRRRASAILQGWHPPPPVH